MIQLHVAICSGHKNWVDGMPEVVETDPVTYKSVMGTPLYATIRVPTVKMGQQDQIFDLTYS